MIRANDKGLNTPPVVVEGAPRGRGLISPRNILIVVGVVAWLIVLALFVLPRFTAKPAAQAASPAASAQASAAAQVSAAPVQAASQTDTAGTADSAGLPVAAPKAVPAPELDIQNRVINLSGAGGYKYLKMSIAVTFTDPKGAFAKANGAALAKLETAFAADNAPAISAFNDIITTTVSSKTSAELTTTDGKQALRQELIGKFNQALGGKERVAYIDFIDFVMQ